MHGWIKLHRELLKSNIFQNEKLLKVFMYCLLKASHTDYTAKVGLQNIDLKPGQFVYGRKKAALELDMKESTVRDYMKLLKDDSTIAMNSTNKYTVVTIVKWGEYQNEIEPPRQQNDSRMTADRQQNDTYKNDKNVKNDKETVAADDFAFEADFHESQSTNEENPHNMYQKCFGIFPTGMISQQINSYLSDGMEEKVVATAIYKAAQNGKEFGYARGILNNWFRDSVLTYKQVEEEQAAYKQKKETAPFKAINGGKQNELPGYDEQPKLDFSKRKRV